MKRREPPKPPGEGTGERRPSAGQEQPGAGGQLPQAHTVQQQIAAAMPRRRAALEPEEEETDSEASSVSGFPGDAPGTGTGQPGPTGQRQALAQAGGTLGTQTTQGGTSVEGPMDVHVPPPPPPSRKPGRVRTVGDTTVTDYTGPRPNVSQEPAQTAAGGRQTLGTLEGDEARTLTKTPPPRTTDTTPGQAQTVAQTSTTTAPPSTTAAAQTEERRTVAERVAALNAASQKTTTATQRGTAPTQQGQTPAQVPGGQRPRPDSVPTVIASALRTSGYGPQQTTPPPVGGAPTTPPVMAQEVGPVPIALVAQQQGGATRAGESVIEFDVPVANADGVQAVDWSVPNKYVPFFHDERAHNLIFEYMVTYFQFHPQVENRQVIANLKTALQDILDAVTDTRTKALTEDDIRVLELVVQSKVQALVDESLAASGGLGTPTQSALQLERARLRERSAATSTQTMRPLHTAATRTTSTRAGAQQELRLKVNDKSYTFTYAAEFEPLFNRTLALSGIPVITKFIRDLQKLHKSDAHINEHLSTISALLDPVTFEKTGGKIVANPANVEQIATLCKAVIRSVEPSSGPPL